MSRIHSLKKRLLAAAAAGTMLLTFPLSGCNKPPEESNQQQSVSQGEKTTKFGNNIVVKSDNYQISFPLARYLYNNLYYRFMNGYGSYYIDSTKSLREQTYPEDTSMTWHDYFVQNTKNYLQQIIVFAEAAKTAGIEMADSDQSYIDETFVQLSSMAEESGVGFDDLLKKQYGEGVTKEDIELILQMTFVSQNYATQVYNEFNYTQDQYDKYFEENKTDFLYADYLSFSFPYSALNEEGTSMAVDEEKKKAAKEYADALSSCKTKEEFEEWVTKYLNDNPSQVTMTTASAEESVTEEDFKQAVAAKVKSVENKKTKYADNTELLKWVFEEGRKEKDSSTIDTGSAYTAALVLKPAYRDEALTKNVRHILIGVGQYSNGLDRSDEDAKALADDVYAKWKDGAATEDSFAALAGEYTDDAGSKEKGGLYEDVVEGEMTPEFNNWCFDSSRKGGDSGIVKTDFGYHIMYFVSSGDPAWIGTVDAAMRNRDRSAKYDEFCEKYKVDFDDDALKEMEIISFTEESAVESGTESSEAPASTEPSKEDTASSGS